MEETLSGLLEVLEYAKRDFQECHRERCEAENKEITALNKLNAAQKKFDQLVYDLKKSAIPESDWGKEARDE